MWRFLLLLMVVGVLGCGSSEESGQTSQVSKTGLTSEETAVRKTESDPELVAIVDRTNKFLQVGHFSKAMDQISHAMVKFPENPSLFRIRAILHHKTGQTGSAMTDYLQAVRLDPRNPELHNEVGFYLFSVGEVEAGQKHLLKAVELDPEFEIAYNHLGLVQIARGELTDAKESLTRALEIEPKYVDALINRGFASYQLKQFDEALEDYHAALEINPDAVNAHNNRGLIDFEKQNYDEAVASFTKCIMIDPKTPKYYEHRRLAYLKLGMKTEAAEDARKWQQLQRHQLVNQQIVRQPANAIGYLARAELAFRDERYQEALVDFDRAIRLNSNLIQAWFGRAKTRFALEEYELAVQDCTHVIEIKPLQPAYSLRGDAYMKLEKIDQAIADFHTAKRLDPSVAEAFLMKAEELESLGQSDAAQEYRDKAKNLFPDLELTPNAN